MTSAFAILLFATMPPVFGTPTVDCVSEVELNRVYNGEGDRILLQMIFWSDYGDEYHVVAWRLWRDDSPLPSWCYHRARYVLIWSDGDTMRMIVAKKFTESWTQFDVELRDRAQFGTEHRRGLTKETDYRPQGTPTPASEADLTP